MTRVTTAKQPKHSFNRLLQSDSTCPHHIKNWHHGCHVISVINRTTQVGTHHTSTCRNRPTPQTLSLGKRPCQLGAHIYPLGSQAAHAAQTSPQGCRHHEDTVYSHSSQLCKPCLYCIHPSPPTHTPGLTSSSQGQPDQLPPQQPPSNTLQADQGLPYGLCQQQAQVLQY